MRKKRETVEDEVGRVHRVKAEVGKAEVPQDELGRNRPPRLFFFDPMRYLRNLQNKECMRKYVLYKKPQHPKSGAGGSAPIGVPSARCVSQR